MLLQNKSAAFLVFPDLPPHLLYRTIGWSRLVLLSHNRTHVSRSDKQTILPRRDARKIIEVGVLLSLTSTSSVTRHLQHRVLYQALYHLDLLPPYAPFPFELLIRYVPSDSVVCTTHVTDLAAQSIKLLPPVINHTTCHERDEMTSNSAFVPMTWTEYAREKVDFPLSKPALDWKALLFAWGELSQEYIVVITSNRVVHYANRRARDRFSLHAGTLVDEQWERELMHNWTLEHVDVGEEAQYCLLLIRPRTTFCAEEPPANTFPTIQTNSPLYRAQLKTAAIAALSTTNTLLLGETGSGKEVLARAIHASSARGNGPFIAVNIACLPRDLIASELFGYTDGAFTGAKKGGQIGKFEAANGGTLFLDEIGEMPVDLQVILLRVLEERKVMRLGSHDEKPLDVRIIAATNRELEEEVKAGRFRADLYYRLNVLQICIPSLRERKEDIAPLAFVFLGQLRDQYGRGPTEICETALPLLQHHTWRGNVRELRNVMERAFLLAIEESMITAQHLPINWTAPTAPQTELLTQDNSLLRDVERQTIQLAITEADTLSAAAKKLGCARSTLYRKMRELGIGPFN
ncbi:sigma-54 interaction domain-containing protein [Brevibacillus sp. NRS-1366]|uniref:sigma-54 interaction domain-containing protein n=1 Tax=Brevibacillus sp. NRS-1366 TaxID=3233899 RepID=UPI003D1CE27E